MHTHGDNSIVDSMEQSSVCHGDYIVDKCVLKIIHSYLQDNPILCNGCNVQTVHECMYMWNTGTVIAKHIETHIHQSEIS